MPLMLLMGLSVAAETSLPSNTLAYAVEQAWLRHPQSALLAARDLESQAAQDRANAISPDPASILLGRINDRQGKNLGKDEWEIAFSMPLWLYGQRQAYQDEAQSFVDEITAQRHAKKLEVAGEVREAWWALAMARTANRLAQQKHDIAQALEQESQRRYKAGDSSRIEANDIQAQWLSAQAEQLEAQNALMQAEQAFELLTGMKPPLAWVEETPHDLHDEAKRHAINGAHEATPSLMNEAAMQTLLSSHPLLILATAASRTALAKVRSAEASTRAAPELSMKLLRERGDFAEPYTNQLGINLKIPFSSAPQRRRESAAAMAEWAVAESERLQLIRRINQDIERARLALVNAQHTFTSAQRRLDLANDNWQLTEKSFKWGEANLATLLSARGKAFEALSNLERQRINQAQAVSRYHQAMGVLP